MTTHNVFCEWCDTRNPEDAHFCVMCGKPLRVLRAQAAPVAVPTRPAGYTQGYAPPPAAYAPGYGAAPVVAGASGPVIQHIYVNQTGPGVVVQQQALGFLVRAVWFLFAGLWLGQIWLLLAWLFNLSLIGLPLGMWMLNKMPQVMTLRPNQQQVSITPSGLLILRQAGPSFVVRALYFVLIGWWASLIWLQLAWLASVTLIGLPLSFLMFERTAAVATLGE